MTITLSGDDGDEDDGNNDLIKKKIMMIWHQVGLLTVEEDLKRVAAVREALGPKVFYQNDVLNLKWIYRILRNLFQGGSHGWL